MVAGIRRTNDACSRCKPSHLHPYSQAQGRHAFLRPLFTLSGGGRFSEIPAMRAEVSLHLPPTDFATILHFDTRQGILVARTHARLTLYEMCLLCQLALDMRRWRRPPFLSLIAVAGWLICSLKGVNSPHRGTPTHSHRYGLNRYRRMNDMHRNRTWTCCGKAQRSSPWLWLCGALPSAPASSPVSAPVVLRCEDHCDLQ